MKVVVRQTYKEYTILDLMSGKDWLGEIIYSVTGKRGKVHEIEVKERGKGYGSFLIREAKKQMKAKGAKTIKVSFITPASVGFWKKMNLRWIDIG